MKSIYWYEKILRIRLIEEEIAHRYPQGKMRCPTHLSIGQEAVPVGISHYLNPDDKVYSTHRAHAHYLAKGGSLNKLIAELYGKATGCTGGRGGSMHLSDLDVGFIASTAIVGNSIPLAVGNALHQQLQGSNSITVSYFGDGATEEGAFYEAANFAVLRKLPVLFVCENNRYSVYSPLKVRQPLDRNIKNLAQSLGLESFSANGNEIDAIHTVAKTAINTIRQGYGPSFIEFDTYRHREHCGPNFDDDLGYRPNAEVESWLANDPLILLEQTLKSDESWLAKKEQLMKALNHEINQAFDFAESSAFPSALDNERYIYAQ